MRNGRFHPPKCRGKLQKMGVLHIHSPKRLGPFSKLPKKVYKNSKKFKKGGTEFDRAKAAPRLAGDR